MKYGRISLLLTAAAMALSAAPSQAAVIVRVGPPVARFERVPVAPAPGYVWRAGYWRWTGARYVWVGGAYLAAPYPRAAWIPGHWVGGPRGWVWIDGRWR